MSESKKLGGSGGSPFTLACADGTFITEVSGRYGGVVNSLNIKCSNGETKGPVGGKGGGAGGTPYNSTCSKGIDGMEASVGGLVDAIKFACGGALEQTKHGGEGGVANIFQCPSGQVAVSLSGGEGDLIDSIQMKCAAISGTSSVNTWIIVGIVVCLFIIICGGGTFFYFAKKGQQAQQML